MALKTSGEPGFYGLDGSVMFVMLDDIKYVFCTLTPDAIDDLDVGTSPTPLERINRFKRHRARIEAIAGENYRRGDAAPRVTRDQLCAAQNEA
jgi:hypothetical protein